MHSTILMLAAAAAAAAPAPAYHPKLRTCPDLAAFTKASTPLQTTSNYTLMPKLVTRMHIEKGDFVQTTKPFMDEGIPMTLFVHRKPGVAAYTHIYAVCVVPWGQMVCGQADMQSTGTTPAPAISARLYKGSPVALFTDKSGGKDRTTVWTFNQSVGFQPVCEL